MRNLNASRSARFRPGLIAAIMLPLLILLWAWYELWLAYTISPTIQKNYGGMLREVAESWQDTSGSNGWDALMEASRLLEEHNDKFLYTDENGVDWDLYYWRYETITDPEVVKRFVAAVYDYDLTPEELEKHFERARAWAVDTIHSLDEIGIAAQLQLLSESSYALMPIPDSEAGKPLNIMLMSSSTRRLGQCMRARMQLARDNNDWDAYLESYGWLIKISRALAYQPGTMNPMIATAILSLGIEQVIEDVQHGVLPDEVVLALGDSTDRLPTAAQIRRVYDAERYVQLDLLQQLFGPGGRLILTEYAKLVPFAEEEPWIKNVQGRWKPGWDHYERHIHAYQDEIGRIRDISFAEREPMRPESRARGLAQRFADPQPDDEPLPMFDPTKSFAERFLDTDVAFSLADQELRHALLCEGVTLLLAIERYRIQSGEYPSVLDELVPEYINTVGIDPCSPDARPWVYRKHDDPDGEGRLYTLFSVGFDMQDDGGARPIVHYANALQRKYAGSDYVLTHPPMPEEDE